MDLLGNPSAECKYLTVSPVETITYTLWIASWGAGQSINRLSMLSLYTQSLMVTLHNPLLSRHPCRTNSFPPLSKYSLWDNYHFVWCNDRFNMLIFLSPKTWSFCWFNYGVPAPISCCWSIFIFLSHFIAILCFKLGLRCWSSDVILLSLSNYG